MAATTGEKQKPPSKNQILVELGESTGLTRKQIESVLDGLEGIIKREIGKKGSGVFALPGLLKIKRVEKPATKARKGRNPLSGEEIEIKAKPKRTVVKVQPLKGLKEAV